MAEMVLTAVIGGNIDIWDKGLSTPYPNFYIR